MVSLWRQVVKDRLRLVAGVAGGVVVRWPGKPPWSCREQRPFSDAELAEHEASAVIVVAYTEEPPRLSKPRKGGSSAPSEIM